MKKIMLYYNKFKNYSIYKQTNRNFCNSGGLKKKKRIDFENFKF